jgi:murein L,D-transpeptidase YafK
MFTARSLSKVLLAALLGSLSVALYAAHMRLQNASLQVARPAERGEPLQESSTAGPSTQERLDRDLARLETRLSKHPKDYEASLLKGLLYFKSGKLADALDELNRLTHRAPKFQLAYLIRGDLLLAQTQTVTDIGRSPLIASLKGEDKRLQQLRDEARVRVQAYLSSLQQRMLPQALLDMGDSIKTALVVDKRTHRLFVYGKDEKGDGSLHLIRDFYVSTGKLMGNKTLRGDLRTPEGVYFVTRHIPEDKLPDEYGDGAYPTNYPNEYDRHLGKTGGGIWLHGTAADYYSRPPLDSEGCVVLTNVDLDAVGRYVRPGRTPVVIADGVKWLRPDQWKAERRALLATLEQWRKDWESGDVDRYLDHYADDFWSGDLDLARWDARKRRIARTKTYQKIRLDDISLFAYPPSATDGREIVVADFRQDYRSNNFSSDMAKRLYLAREDGQWKILYEGGQ